jgi:hypothetical protein
MMSHRGHLVQITPQIVAAHKRTLPAFLIVSPPLFSTDSRKGMRFAREKERRRLSKGCKQNASCTTPSPSRWPTPSAAPRPPCFASLLAQEPTTKLSERKGSRPRTGWRGEIAGGYGREMAAGLADHHPIPLFVALDSRLRASDARG